MKLHIIHLPNRIDRQHLIENQIIDQKINDYQIWDGIIEENPKIGIAKAHKQIIKWAKNQNLNSVIIAEDDIKFTAPGAFDYFKSNEPKEYDLYLGGIIYGKINPDNTVNDFSGLTLYKIHQRFYNTFLSIPEGADIDRELINKGKFIVCNPIVAIQHNGFSDNTKKYQNYDPCIKSRSLFQ